MDDSLILEEVDRSFGELAVLERVGFELAPGRVLAVIGPSGCGKSTLLRLIAGLDEPDSGRILVAGMQERADRLASCAWMPQSDCLLPWFDALDNAAIALRNGGSSRASARAGALPVFERMGLAGFESARPKDLSGGMRQRVAFARTWLSGKRILLLDEPFAALDGLTRRGLQEWLAPLLSEAGRAAVLVTHDLDEALYLGDAVLVMSARPGRVVGLVDAPPRDGDDPIRASGSERFGRAREELASLLDEPAPEPEGRR